MNFEVQYKGKLTVSKWLEFIDYVLHYLQCTQTQSSMSHFTDAT